MQKFPRAEVGPELRNQRCWWVCTSESWRLSWLILHPIYDIAVGTRPSCTPRSNVCASSGDLVDTPVSNQISVRPYFGYSEYQLESAPSVPGGEVKRTQRKTRRHDAVLT